MAVGALCAALALSLDEEGAYLRGIPLVVGRRALHLQEGIARLCLQKYTQSSSASVLELQGHCSEASSEQICCTD